MKRWSEFELIVLVGIVALVVTFVQKGHLFESSEGDKAPPVVAVTEKDYEAWEVHFKTAQQAVHEKDFELAERELLAAEQLARLFPAGDKRLAETLDDMGLVYFSMGDPAKAMEVQGRAVAALLLSQGPNDPELDVYIQRFAWAHREAKSDSVLLRTPVEFLAAYNPGTSDARYMEESLRLRQDHNIALPGDSIEVNN